MVDGMNDVMTRIHQIRSRFGLTRRHNSAGQGQQNNQVNQNAQQGSRIQVPNAPRVTMTQPNSQNIGVQGTQQNGNSTMQQQRLQQLQQGISSLLQNRGAAGTGTENNGMGNQGFLRSLMEAVQRNNNNSQ